MNPETNSPRHSKLTKFICQELLYEFATGRLDEERQKAMDTYLTGCRDSQRELERLKKGLRYASLSLKTEVAEDLREALLGFEPQWKRQLTAWTQWSSTRGWKILPYAFLGSALTLGVIVWKPWRAALHNETVLVEQVKIEPDIISPPAEIKLPSADVVAPISATTGDIPAPAVEPVKAAAGSLTRGEIEVSDFQNASNAIKEKIQALGGKVAGNVELGWLRRKNESYFHFSLPESNEQELDLFLKTFGPVRFIREAHPRVMPEGQIRIILTVKDGDSHEDREETEAP